MDYKIIFVFMNNEEVGLMVSEDSISPLMATLYQDEIYWNGGKTIGFWLDLTKVKYIQFIANKDKNNDETTEDREGTKKIFKYSDYNKDTEGYSGSE